jgi:glycosyltransferase involved in cell wall biosynthesis
MNSQHPLVVFNAHLLSRDASYRSAGISVYIAALLEQFARDAGGLRFHILMGPGASPEAARLPASHARVPTQHPWLRIAWEQTALTVHARRLRADLLHGPAFVGPLLSPCPQVITVHDLSFLRHPDFFRTGNRLYLSVFTGAACRRAKAVIAVSDYTAREVAALLRVPEARIFRVYHGVAPRFRALPEAVVADFRQRQGLPARFVLYLGTLEPRKNLIRLVRAFERQRDPDLHLVLAGAQGWFYADILKEVDRLGLRGRVHFPGFVPTADQALWYNAADAFAYVSIYEGLGMPVIEALACGTPVLTSSTTALPEAGGAGALLVQPEDEGAIAEGLHALLTDDDLRCRLREQGPGHAQTFSWEATARETLDVYRRVLAGAEAR